MLVRAAAAAGQERSAYRPILVLAGVLATAAAVAGDQPQWGQRFTRNMVSDEKGLPDTFDPVTRKNVKWTAKLGTQSYSTPLVAGGKIFVGTNNTPPRDPKHKDDSGVLLCLDEKDGKLCWQLVVPKREGDQYLDWPQTGWCSPVTVEGDRVYTVTNRGEAVCLDIAGLANGNDGPYADEGQHMAVKGKPPHELSPTDADIIWMADMVAGAGIYTHDGAHSSILIDGPFLYLNTGNGVDNTHRKIRCPDAPSLIVLDKATGKLLAQDDEHIGPNIVHAAWSSPAMGDVNGQKLVFFGGGNGVCYAFEALKAAPSDGQVAKLKRVWSFDCDPTAPKENIHRFQGNKKEGPSIIIGMPVFHDNRVYVVDSGDIWWGRPQAWLKCIDAAKTGDITTSGAVWSYALAGQSMSTPAVADGLAYITDCGRKIHCVDAATGQACWTHVVNGPLWSSTLVADGKVYVGSERNEFVILAAGREKKVLCSVMLDSAISGTPTAANGVLYIATMNTLYAVRKAE